MSRPKPTIIIIVTTASSLLSLLFLQLQRQQGAAVRDHGHDFALAGSWGNRLNMVGYWVAQNLQPTKNRGKTHSWSGNTTVTPIYHAVSTVLLPFDMVSAPKVLLVVLTVVTLWCSALLYLHVNVAVEPKVDVFHLGLSWNMRRLPTMAMCFRQEEEDYYCCYYYYYVIKITTSYYKIVIMIITIIIVIILIVINY